MVYYIMLLGLITPTLINGNCIDIHSHIVNQGLHYVPGPNSCTVCICDKGNPKWCKSVLCSPPQDCQSFQVGNSCCEFKCLDDILNKSDNYNDTYDMALRLIASLVTAVLSLSLLFFLIHRLRQRKIRLSQNSQLNDDHHSFNGIGYITGSLGYLSGSMGYLSPASNDIEYHYNEANYPFWKPSGNYFPRGEAPPPYEEAVRAARTETNLLNMNTNLTPFSFTTNGSENVSLTLVHNTHVNITPNVQSHNQETSEIAQQQQQQYNMTLQTEQHSEPISVEERQVNNSSTNVRLVCRPSTGKNCSLNASSSLVQNSMLVNQVDIHSDNGVSLPIVMLAANKSKSDNTQEQIKNHFVNSKSDHQVNNIGQQSHPEVTYKNIPSTTSGCSKSSNCDSRTLNKKVKSSSSLVKEVREPVRKSKASSKVYLKDCEQPKISSLNSNPTKQSASLQQNTSYMTGAKHRTIPQIYSTSLSIPTEPEIWIPEEIIDKSHSSKEHSNSYKSSNSHETPFSSRKNDYSLHCTLPKGLRDLNNAFNFNFTTPNDCHSNDVEARDSSLPTTALLMKGNKEDNNCELYYTNIEALKNKLYAQQSEKRNQGKSYKSSMQKSTSNRMEKSKSATLPEPQIQQEETPSAATHSNARTAVTASSSIETSDGTEASCLDKNINMYYCTSPIQDLDDYRSECENCKSLSFENCSEEMDVLNETMTLQRHPVEQDENQMYYRTSLTLPSHSKKVRSVMLNTSRESWFMAMQEITSSSDSD